MYYGPKSYNFQAKKKNALTLNAQKSNGDVGQKIKIKPLRETNVGVAQA